MNIYNLCRKLFVLAFMVPVLITGCAAPISKEAKQDLGESVNCATAEADLRSLHAEKAHLSKEIENGASAIIPIGLVYHLVKHDEKDAFKVGTGEYNKALDKKIAEIKSQCGI